MHPARRTALVAALVVTMSGAGATSATSATAASTGAHFANLAAPGSIVTGQSWTLTGTVLDAQGNPAPNQTVYAGVQEPSTGCGDPAAATCTDTVDREASTDAGGAFTITGSSRLDTSVVLYLADDQGSFDPTTAQQLAIHTHNLYAWSGPTSGSLSIYKIGGVATLRQDGAGSSIAVDTGAAVPHTQVSTDGGSTWVTISSGTQGGALPVVTPFGTVGIVRLFASKPGTYHVRIVDDPGNFEDAAASPTVIVKVAKRTVPGWLVRTNAFRRSIGVAPVAENGAYDAALAKHVHWMNLHNVLSHSETPHTRGYSTAGNEAGLHSDIAVGPTKPRSAVDEWIGAPFHATCLLNPYWAVGGFAIEDGWSGEWCQSDVQTLDLASHRHSPYQPTLTRPQTFPSSHMPVPVDLLVNANESPDPVAHCTANSAGGAWGVPVVFRVPNPPAGDPKLAHATAVLKSSTGHRVPTCLITGGTYRGRDSGQTQLGRAVLSSPMGGQWAVLMPGALLKKGAKYVATLTDGGYTQKTTFTIATK